MIGGIKKEEKGKNLNSKMIMSEDVKNSLRRYCEEYRVKESEFVRNSIEKNLVTELNNIGKEII